MQTYLFAIITSCLTLVTFCGCGTKPVTDPLAGVGGYRLVYKQREGKTADTRQIERVIRERINVTDSGEVFVHPRTGGGCEILLPGADEQRVADVKKIIDSGNMLEFRIVALKGRDDKLIAACEDGQDHKGAAWARYDAVEITNFPPEAALLTTADGKSKVLIIADDQSVDARHVKHAERGRDESLRPCVLCEFTKEGAARMQKLTSSNRHRQLAIIVDGSLISAPTIQSAFGDRCQLTGKFTVKEVEFLVAILQYAQMFADLEPTPISEEKVAAESKQ